MTDHSPLLTFGPVLSAPVEKRAAVLRERLASPGRRVRLLGTGRVELRAGDGRVLATYGRDALDEVLQTGALAVVRDRAGSHPATTYVEYALAPPDGPVGGDSVARQPVLASPARTPGRTPERAADQGLVEVTLPAMGEELTQSALGERLRFEWSMSDRVKRAIAGTTWRYRAPENPRRGKLYTVDEALVSALRTAGFAVSHEAPSEPEPEPEPEPPAFPTEPTPLADGTRCVGWQALADQYGVPRPTVRTALEKGRVDRGPDYLPPGAGGTAWRSVALTERTLAFAREQWTRPQKRASLPPYGTEVLQGDLSRLLGYKARASRGVLGVLDAEATWRYRWPSSPRRGKLYTVDALLVGALERLDYAVEVAEAERPLPEAPSLPGAPPIRSSGAATLAVVALLGSPTAADVEPHLEVTVSSTHARLRRLEGAGLVERSHVEDGYAWTPTDAGRQALAALALDAARQAA